jgi:hypothetical protein
VGEKALASLTEMSWRTVGRVGPWAYQRSTDGRRRALSRNIVLNDEYDRRWLDGESDLLGETYSQRLADWEQSDRRTSPPRPEAHWLVRGLNLLGPIIPFIVRGADRAA